jgi:FemAB-related protein (PEP-CTERM system-associated)
VAVSSEPPDWTDYLARHPDTTLLHDPRWGVVMREAYGNAPFYLTVKRGERSVGLLQLVLQRSLLFGTHLSSLPYFDASGIVADDPAAAAALLGEADALRTQTRSEWVELRHTDPLPGNLARREDKVTLRLPLPDDPDALWKALKSKVRSQVRKPEKEGLTLHGPGEATLEEFHAVYVRTMRDLGSPPHGRRFFEIVRARFGDAVRLFAVRRDGVPMAASLTLTDAKAMRVPWAAADWRFRKLGANMLLYWGMLKDGCERGAPCFDFGRSTEGSGTHRFKKQWGAEDVGLCWQYVLPEGGDAPALDPESPKYRFLTACWRKLPLPVARLVGPRLIAKVS